MNGTQDVFHVVMIKPTHYHDDGYPIRWLFSPIPSNSLASVYGLSLDCEARKVLGENVRLEQHVMDETKSTFNHKKLIRSDRRDGGKALICMIGVQSNQFPRAVDLSQPFLEGRPAGLHRRVPRLRLHSPCCRKCPTT